MTTSKRARDFLIEIARCPNVDTCIDGSEAHPCHSIVSHQPLDLRERHVPEPWNGRIDSPILFLSSNPSIDAAELFPDWSWSDDDIVDFFENRFGGGKRWAEGHLYPLLKNGERKRQWVSFWANVNKLAQELLRRPANPAIDYAMSEVVHCKSTSQSGVREALEECTQRYLDRLVAVSSARVIVLLGRHAGSIVRKRFDLQTEKSVTGPVRVGTLERTFVFLPHPNAHVKRTFKACLQDSELRRLQKLVSGGRPV